jgi:hypothetical protein
MIVRLYPLPFIAHSADQSNIAELRLCSHTQTNARLGSHLGFNAWNLTTSSGSTIKSALDFTMSTPISLGTGNNSSSSNSSEDSTTMLLFLPSVGASAIVYGDGDTRGRYVAFLESEEVNYPAQPWFFWNQPLDDSGWVSAHFGSAGPGATTTSTAPTASPSKGKGGERGLLGSCFGRLFLGAATLVSLHILLFV